MLILDSNVISELMRQEPNQAVIDWLDNQSALSIWTTSICIFEVEMGLRLMPDGERREALATLFEQMISDDLQSRVLIFGHDTAIKTATLAVQARQSGKNVDMRDLMIAGIVAEHGATLITRNTKHFKNFDIRLLNPWDAE